MGIQFARSTNLHDFFVANFILIHLFLDEFAIAVAVQCGNMHERLREVDNGGRGRHHRRGIMSNVD